MGGVHFLDTDHGIAGLDIGQELLATVQEPVFLAKERPVLEKDLPQPRSKLPGLIGISRLCGLQAKPGACPDVLVGELVLGQVTPLPSPCGCETDLIIEQSPVEAEFTPGRVDLPNQLPADRTDALIGARLFHGLESQACFIG